VTFYTKMEQIPITDPILIRMFEMSKNQNELAECWRQQQREKRKEYNKEQMAKRYYGNSKEYRRDWAKNGAMINK